MAKKPLKMFKVNNISEVRDVDALYFIKTATDTEFSIVVTDAFGAIVNLKGLQTPAGIQGIASDDGTIEVTGGNFKNIRLSATLVDAINSALKPGDNISDLINDAGYLTSFTEIDPIFQASEASNFVSGDKANLDNQSGINTGDETSTSIQAKRPLKTVDNKSLEGTGNIEIDYNTVINKPTSFPPSTHTHTISEVINLQNELNSKENISNKVNTISGNSSVDYTTEKAVVDYVSSQIGADFAKVVYFDNVTPNVASIFDLNNPPLVNDPSLKEDVANLYIGTDASTWVYITSPAGYVTKTVTSSGSNFYITGTNTDAGSIKAGSITKKGQFVIDSEVVNDSGLTLKKTESSILKTDSLGKVVKATNLQDVEYAPIVHTHTVSQITDFPTFKTIEGQSIIGVGNIDLDKVSVGLGNVDNTSDLNKIISTATQTALNAKANISGQVFTGAVSATNLSGTNTGDNAPNSLYSGLISNAYHIGEVTGSGALTIANGVVINSKLATVATATIKGRVTADYGIVEDLTSSQVRTLLNVADGANNYVHPATHLASIITQDASNRFVTDTEKSAWNAKEPAIASGTISQYWRGDKTWQEFPTIQTIDNIPTDGSNNAVSSNGVFDALATKAPISSVHNPVTLGTANGLSLATQQLSLGLASSGVTGALSGTDWNTFNNKQDALGFTPENVDNKAIDFSVVDNVKYPTVQAVKGQLDTKTENVASFSQLSTLVTGSEIVYVNDLYRGGFFKKYAGIDPIDEGVIFPGVSGSKWQRILQTDTPLLQWWGVDGNGTTDNIINVNRALTFCGTYGYKYLTVTGIIKITGRLNDYKNKVLFVGSGIFNSTYKGNYAESDVSNSEVSFSGKINKDGYLNKTLQIIKADTGLKIVVFGNSIAYGRDYNTQNPEGSFYEIVNNETNENSWYGNFVRQLQNKFHDKNITSINRAIPGYAISDYLDVISSEPAPNQPSWLDGTMTGKTWAKIMEDDAPDVIIIEHGMNSGSEYIEYAKAFVDLTKTWTKVPELVFMSTPTLNYIDALGTDWGGTPRLTKLDVQNQQANLSNYYNSYLIDVAKIANIKRYGSDYRNFTFKPRTIESFSFLNGASDLGGGVLGIPASGVVSLNRVSQAPKFYLNLSIKPSSSFTSIRIYTGSAFLIFSPTGVTVYPCTTSGNILPPVSQTYALPIGVSTNIKVEFGDFLNLYIGNELIVSSKVSSPVVNVLDDIKIDISGTTGVSEISDLSYYEAEFTKYKPTLTGTELWGELGFGNDGNAINHPSLTGVAETYNQAVNEFVNYLYDNSKTVSSIQSIVGTANQVIVTPVDGVNTLSLPQSIAPTSAPTFGGLAIPYAIFANGTRSYSIENIGSSVALTDVTGGAVRWIVNSSGVMDFQQIPTAPTAPAGTNTSQIATTAFVQAIASSGVYAASISNASNIGGITIGRANYMKIGNVVSVNFSGSATFITTSTSATFEISLPFNKTLTNNAFTVGSAIPVSAGIISTGIIQHINSVSTVRVTINSSAMNGLGSISGSFMYNIDD